MSTLEKRPDTELAEEIEDIAGIGYDLMAVRDWCVIARQMPEPPTDPTQATVDAKAKQAIVAGILITYRRVFVQSHNRTSYPGDLKDTVVNQEPHVGPNHGSVLASASKYIAHSYNAYEQSAVRVEINSDTYDVGETKVQHGRLIIDNVKLAMIEDLAHRFIEALEPRFEDLKAQLGAVVEALDPQDRAQLSDARDLSNPPPQIDPTDTR